MNSLYEITYKKTSLNETGDATFTITKRYQVVAANEVGATFRLGQIFNNDEAYEIEVVQVKKVYTI